MKNCKHNVGERVTQKYNGKQENAWDNYGKQWKEELNGKKKEINRKKRNIMADRNHDEFDFLSDM